MYIYYVPVYRPGKLGSDCTYFAVCPVYVRIIGLPDLSRNIYFMDNTVPPIISWKLCVIKRNIEPEKEMDG